MKTGTASLLLCGLLLGGGCGADRGETLERIRGEGILRVGTDATYPPFEIVDSREGTVVGFDADLMRRIGEDLGAEVRFEVVPFDGILAALRSRKFDAVISAMTITEERGAVVLFSRPYHAAGQSLCIRSDSPVRTFQDLRGRRIGVQLGTTGEMAARRVQNGEVVSYDAIGAAWIDLRNGRVDAVIADLPTALLVSRKHPEIRIVGEPLTRESYGIALRKEDRKLKERIDGILERLEEDGTLPALRRRWGLELP